MYSLFYYDTKYYKLFWSEKFIYAQKDKPYIITDLLLDVAKLLIISIRYLKNPINLLLLFIVGTLVSLWYIYSIVVIILFIIMPNIHIKIKTKNILKMYLINTQYLYSRSVKKKLNQFLNKKTITTSINKVVISKILGIPLKSVELVFWCFTSIELIFSRSYKKKLKIIPKYIYLETRAWLVKIYKIQIEYRLLKDTK